MKTKLSVKDAIAIANIYKANWVAIDQDDKKVFVYHKKPKQHENNFWYVDDNDYGIEIGLSDSTWESWNKSLIEVNKVATEKRTYRLAVPSDIVEGATVYIYGDNKLYNKMVIEEVYSSSDQWKAFTANDGCRYGLLDCYVRIDSGKFHKVSKEVLYHYQCGSCNRWWSIGDVLLERAFCPNCGVLHEVGEIENDT